METFDDLVVTDMLNVELDDEEESNLLLVISELLADSMVFEVVCWILNVLLLRCSMDWRWVDSLYDKALWLIDTEMRLSFVDDVVVVG